MSRPAELDQVEWRLGRLRVISSSSYPRMWQQMGLTCLVTQMDVQKHDATKLGNQNPGEEAEASWRRVPCLMRQILHTACMKVYCREDEENIVCVMLPDELNFMYEKHFIYMCHVLTPNRRSPSMLSATLRLTCVKSGGNSKNPGPLLYLLIKLFKFKMKTHHKF